MHATEQLDHSAPSCIVRPPHAEPLQLLHDAIIDEHKGSTLYMFSQKSLHTEILAGIQQDYIVECVEQRQPVKTLGLLYISASVAIAMTCGMAQKRKMFWSRSASMYCRQYGACLQEKVIQYPKHL